MSCLADAVAHGVSRQGAETRLISVNFLIALIIGKGGQRWRRHGLYSGQPSVACFALIGVNVCIF